MVFEEDDSPYDESDADEGDHEEIALDPLPTNKSVMGKHNSRRLIERRLELLKLREQVEDPGFNCDFD